uniref:Uncharacterized protein n=1 Tax=Siphoviridae sp. cteoh1 TaxID=2826407 RepID=A0A8S5QKG4_9CAUD|nr:MAG TPA: hypothetical protein [Siphoviridae sp. cteoh1]
MILINLLRILRKKMIFLRIFSGNWAIIKGLKN